MKIFEKSKIIENSKANNTAPFLKKPFSNNIIAVISPMIAFAIKKPSAKATKFSKLK